MGPISSGYYITLGCKGLPRTNSLAYREVHLKVTKKMQRCQYGSWSVMPEHHKTPFGDRDLVNTQSLDNGLLAI
jgi:hypothetical protein